MTLRVVLPTARAGLVTAVILGVARAVGETAPVLLTAAGNSVLNTNPFDEPQANLPLFVYQQVLSQVDNARARAWTGAFVLIMLVARPVHDRPHRRRPRSRPAAVPPTSPCHPRRLPSPCPATPEECRHMTAVEAVDAPDGAPAVTTTPSTLAAEDVSAWFGTNKVLERVSARDAPRARSPRSSARRAAASRRSSGSSTACTSSCPSASLAGSVRLDGEDIYEPDAPGHRHAPADRHGVPEAEPVPGDDHLRATCSPASSSPGLKVPATRHAAGRELPAAGRAVERGQEPPQRPPAARCRAGSSSGSASPGARGAARRCC